MEESNAGRTEMGREKAGGNLDADLPNRALMVARNDNYIHQPLEESTPSVFESKGRVNHKI